MFQKYVYVENKSNEIKTILFNVFVNTHLA